MTNPIDQLLLLEATVLAQTHCLERLEMLKKLVEDIKEERSIPIYKRPVGPRKTGTELSLMEVDKIVEKASAAKRRSSIKSSTVPVISKADINIEEEMCIS